MMSHILLGRSIQTYGLGVKASHGELGDMGSIPAGCLNSLPPLSHFALQ